MTQKYFFYVKFYIVDISSKMSFKNLSRTHATTHKLGEHESTYVKSNQKKARDLVFPLGRKKKFPQTFKPKKVIVIIMKEYNHR